MKVIKAPNLNWEYECICNKCDAELLVETADVKMTRGISGGSNYFSAVCPFCKNSISITANLVPKIVIVELEKQTPATTSRDFRDGPFEDFHNK